MYVLLVTLCTWSWCLCRCVLSLNLCQVICHVFLYKFNPLGQYIRLVLRSSLVVFQMPVRLSTARVNVFVCCLFIRCKEYPDLPNKNNIIIDFYFTTFFTPLYFYLVYSSLLLQLLNGSAFLLLLNSSVSWTWKMGSAISLIWPQNGHLSQLSCTLFPFFSKTL